MDLWAQVLQLLDTIGSEVQWLCIPLDTGIRRNEGADSLANEEHCKFSPLSG